MKLCIFPQNARDFIPDSSNITYNSEERAQARLCSSAPCLGLSYISIQWTVQCKANGGERLTPGIKIPKPYVYSEQVRCKDKT